MFPVASPAFSCCSAGGGHKSSARSKRPDQRVRVVERVKMFQENPEENMRKHQKTCKMSMFHDVPLALSQMSAKGQLCYGDLDTICPQGLRKHAPNQSYPSFSLDNPVLQIQWVQDSHANPRAKCSLRIQPLGAKTW